MGLRLYVHTALLVPLWVPAHCGRGGSQHCVDTHTVITSAPVSDRRGGRQAAVCGSCVGHVGASKCRVGGGREAAGAQHGAL